MKSAECVRPESAVWAPLSSGRLVFARSKSSASQQAQQLKIHTAGLKTRLKLVAVT